MKPKIALMVIVLSITGCATPGQQSESTSVEQQAKNEGIAAGGIIGALIGGVLGHAIGGDSRSTIAGAIVGAGLGATIGWSYAKSIADRHQELVGKENDLDARIKFARGVNEDTQKYNQQLKEEITASEKKVNMLAARIRTHQITQQELEGERSALKKQAKDANNQLVSGQEELSKLKAFKSQQKSNELDDEIKRLEKNLATTKENTDALASISQRI